MKRKNRYIVIGGLIMAFLLMSPHLFSQAGRGTARLSGTVSDEQRNPIPSAKITLQFLENEEITQETTSDKKGKWKIAGLGSGNWRITASAQGYIPYQNIVNVRQLDRNPLLNITLKKAEEQLIETTPEMELFEQGNRLFQDEKYEEAIAAFQEFLEKNPELYQVHFSLGNCYKEMGKIEEALKEYQLVLENADESIDKDRKLKAKTLAAIGECHLLKNDIDSAQDFFKQSLELDPNDEILAYNVGEIHFSHQKMDEAVDYFELASQIKPDWPDPYLKLGYVYLNKAENAKAVEKFEKFLDLEPDTERSAMVKNIINYLKK